MPKPEIDRNNIEFGLTREQVAKVLLDWVHTIPKDKAGEEIRADRVERYRNTLNYYQSFHLPKKQASLRRRSIFKAHA